MNEPKPWPWRPRSGYPSLPAWLFLVVLAAAVVALVVVTLVIFGTDPTGTNAPGG